MGKQVQLYSTAVVSSVQDTITPVTQRSYSGISTVNPQANSFSLYDIELIKQDLMNHFHIRKGEKLENPTFGTIIWDILYEPMTPSIRSLVEQDVTTIVNYDPRIQVNSITVSSYETGIQVECVLTYLPYNISSQMMFTFDQTNGLM